VGPACTGFKQRVDGITGQGGIDKSLIVGREFPFLDRLMGVQKIRKALGARVGGEEAMDLVVPKIIVCEVRELMS
jgi:hypothetical protein